MRDDEASRDRRSRGWRSSAIPSFFPSRSEAPITDSSFFAVSLIDVSVHLAADFVNNKTRGARFLCSLLEKPALAHVVVALAPGAMVGGKHEDMRPWSPEEDALLLDIVKVSDKRSSLTHSHPFALLNPLAPFALADGGQAVEDHRGAAF